MWLYNYHVCWRSFSVKKLWEMIILPLVLFYWNVLFTSLVLISVVIAKRTRNSLPSLPLINFFISKALLSTYMHVWVSLLEWVFFFFCNTIRSAISVLAWIVAMPFFLDGTHVDWRANRAISRDVILSIARSGLGMHACTSSNSKNLHESKKRVF